MEQTQKRILYISGDLAGMYNSNGESMMKNNLKNVRNCSRENML